MKAAKRASQIKGFMRFSFFKQALTAVILISGGGQEAAKQVPLVVGEIGFVSGDFHRLKSATANESRKKSQSNQGFYAFFFFQTGSNTPCFNRIHFGFCVILLENFPAKKYRSQEVRGFWVSAKIIGQFMVITGIGDWLAIVVKAKDKISILRVPIIKRENSAFLFRKRRNNFFTQNSRTRRCSSSRANILFQAQTS